MVKTGFGNLVFNKKDGLLYAIPRKQYTRVKPIPTGFKIKRSKKREKCAIIKLTNFGYSINQLARALTRTTSFIHKTVKIAIKRKIARFIDKRKLPSNNRLRLSSIRWSNLQKRIKAWLPFINGEVEEPP